ncbi:glycosyltransferase [Sulfurimonas sp.]|uniref:glycosyltransferase n=1 Tax=Sulfurimonas sp. TaxID=2022749 RepID=UPI002B45DBCF|nr:glycosyltransferase [Sulfurimonas sp.]
MLVSVIIPTYKDLEALELILKALESQTYKNFEVVVAEDNDSDDVKEYLKDNNLKLKIKHYSQADDGYQKPKALNGAVKLCEGEYIIFFDGDCLPYSNFVEAHIGNANYNYVLCGRRVNLGDEYSHYLRSKKINVKELEKHFFKNYFKMKKDGARHLECGMKVILKLKFNKLLKTKTALIGCNFSLHKKNLLMINGFDESYSKNTTLADDVDLEWRLQALGLSVKSVKYSAHLLHLNHPRANRVRDNLDNLKIMNNKKLKNKFYCSSGILRPKLS